MQKIVNLLFLTICFFCANTAFASNVESLLKKALDEKLYEATNWKDLLHMQGTKSLVMPDSDFFISKEGYYDPKSELIETIKAFEDSNKKDEHIFCRFPARTAYILEMLSEDVKKWTSGIICPKLDEYNKKVQIDTVSISFAAENNMSPTSMMGHMFLKLSGGQPKKEHAFSFFAIITTQNPFAFYRKLILGRNDGIYSLVPYREKMDEYIINEKRSIWEFEIGLTDTQKIKLKNHLWELKEKIIRYDFMTNNCGTATIHLLKIADPNIVNRNGLIFQTPIEYLQEIQKNGKIDSIHLQTTPEYNRKIQKYDIKDILNTPRASKANLKYIHRNKSLLEFSLHPVYLDILDPTEAYYDYMETKFFSISGQYDLKNKKTFLNTIDIIKIKALKDSSTDFDWSKYLKIAFENRLNDTNTRLKPTIEFGMGYTYTFFGITPYILPKIGYRYDKRHNPYLAIETGTFINLKNTRINAYIESFLDLDGNNRGYNMKFGGSISHRLKEDYILAVGYAHYKGVESGDQKEFTVSAGYFL